MTQHQPHSHELEDDRTTVVFPAPLMSTIQELGAFLAREQAAVTTPTQAPSTPTQTPTTSTPAAGQAPAPDAAFNTDYNGAAAARPR
jgi:hypothetical protein